MDAKQSIAVALVVSSIGWAGTTLTSVVTQLATNSTTLNKVEDDMRHLKIETVQQGKDIAAIKAELVAQEVAALELDKNTNGG